MLAWRSVNMKPSELAILIEEGEGFMLEFKESLSSSFARELVAMANTAGGKILLGVSDDRTVVGIRDSNELRARIQDIARNCDPSVRVQVDRVGKVTVVAVRESDAKPVQCSDGFFWRQGAATQKLSRDEIREFFHSEGVPLSPFSRLRGSSRRRFSPTRRSGRRPRPREPRWRRTSPAECAPSTPRKSPRKCNSRASWWGT